MDLICQPVNHVFALTLTLFRRNGPRWKGEDGVWYWDRSYRVITLSNSVVSDPQLRFSSRLCHSLLCFADHWDTRFLRLRGSFSSWVYSQTRRAYAFFAILAEVYPVFFHANFDLTDGCSTALYDAITMPEQFLEAIGGLFPRQT